MIGHRSGRLPQVARVAAFAERSSGIPGWASLPLLTAMYHRLPPETARTLVAHDGLSRGRATA